jgi:hypothetical protein
MRLNYKDISQYVHSENRTEPILKICPKSSVFRQEGIPAERLLTLLCPSVCTYKPGFITNYKGPAGIFPEICNDVQPLQLPFGSNNINEHFTRKQANVSAPISLSIRTLHACAVSVSFKCSAVDWNRWRHKLSREPDSHF